MRGHASSQSSLTPLTSVTDALPDEHRAHGERTLQDDGLKRLSGIYSHNHHYPQQFPCPSLASPFKEQLSPANETAAVAQSTTTPHSTRLLADHTSELNHTGRSPAHPLSGAPGQQLTNPSDPYTVSISPSSSAPYMTHQDYPVGLVSHNPMQTSSPSYASFRGAPANGMMQIANFDGPAAYGQLPGMIGHGYPSSDVARHDARRVSSTGITAASQYWPCADVNQPGQLHLSSSSATSGGRGGSASSSWDSRPHTAEEASGHPVLYGADSSGTTSDVTRDFHFTPLHERGWSSSSFDSVSPGMSTTQYLGGAASTLQDQEAHSGLGGMSGPTRLAVSQHSVPSGSYTRGGATWSSSPNLEGEWTTERKKRPRRKFSEIDRMYKCAYGDCDRGYGTLNHLNAHVTLHNHGPKRTAEEFREIRREWRARRKEEMRIKEREQAEQGAAHQSIGQQRGPAHDDRSQTSPRTLRLPQASISRPRGNTSSGGSGNVARQHTQVRPGRSASGPTPISGAGGEVMLSPYANMNHGGATVFPSLPSSISPGSSWSSQGSAPGAYQALPRMPPSAYHFPLPLNLPGPEPPTSGSVAPQSIALPSTVRPDGNTFYPQDRGPSAEAQKGGADAERHQAYSSNTPLRGDTPSSGWEGARNEFPHNLSARRV